MTKAKQTKRSKNIHADPTRRFATLFHKLSDSIEEDDLRQAKETVLQLLDHASVLNDFAIWEKLQVSGLPKHVVPLPSAIDRRDEIADSLDGFDEIGDLKSIVSAMEVVDRVFRSMQAQFRKGLLPQDWSTCLNQEDASMQRYMCAATLPAVVDLLDEVWSPLYEELMNSFGER